MCLNNRCLQTQGGRRTQRRRDRLICHFLCLTFLLIWVVSHTVKLPQREAQNFFELTEHGYFFFYVMKKVGIYDSHYILSITFVWLFYVFDQYVLSLNLVFNFMSLLRDVSAVFYEKEKKNECENANIRRVTDTFSIFQTHIHLQSIN